MSSSQAPIVEHVARGEDGVEVHDMDVAAGDRLEVRLVAPARVTAARSTGVATAVPISHTGGDTADQLREWLADFATIA